MSENLDSSVSTNICRTKLWDERGAKSLWFSGMKKLASGLWIIFVSELCKGFDSIGLKGFVSGLCKGFVLRGYKGFVSRLCKGFVSRV